MASQAARLLIQADVLPSLAAPIWNTSDVLSQNTVAGTILHGLIGYDAQPAGMQVVAYVGVLIVIASGGKGNALHAMSRGCGWNDGGVDVLKVG